MIEAVCSDTVCAVLCCALLPCSTVFEDVYQAVVYGIEEQLTGEKGMLCLGILCNGSQW